MLFIVWLGVFLYIQFCGEIADFILQLYFLTGFEFFQELAYNVAAKGEFGLMLFMLPFLWIFYLGVRRGVPTGAL